MRREVLTVAASLLVLVGVGQALGDAREVSRDDPLRERALRAVSQEWSVQRDLHALPGRQPGEVAPRSDAAKRTGNRIAI
jgi:hypothetical protein